MRKRAPVFFAVVFVFLAFTPRVFASTLYLSPGSGTVGIGGTLTVQIRLNTGGEGINGISAYLAYPSDKMEVAWISYGGAFGIAAEGSYGGGGIRISRGSIGAVGGDVNVATVAFRGKSVGTASVSFIGGSGAPRASDSSDSLAGRSGGTYTVSASAPGLGSTQAGGKTNTAGPQISNITVSDLATNSATISWKTDVSSDATVEYGLEKDKYFLSTSNKTAETNHTVKLEGVVFTPGTTYHFRVSSKDDGDNSSLSKDMELQLKGYTVKVRIADKPGSPLRNVAVTLYSDPQKSTTDENGEVTFINISPGKHLVVVVTKSQEKTGEIVVKDTAKPQDFDIRVQGVSAFGKPLPTEGPPVLVLLIVPLVAFLVTLVVFVVHRVKSRNAPKILIQ